MLQNLSTSRLTSDSRVPSIACILSSEMYMILLGSSWRRLMLPSAFGAWVFLYSSELN